MNWSTLHADPKHQLKYPEPIVVRWLSGKPSGTMLDLGCGSGRHTVLGLEGGHVVWALDCAKTALDRTQERLTPRYGEKLFMRLASIDSLPCPDNFFDYVLSWAVLEYAESMDALQQGMDEIRRVLKPGGEALISLRSDEDDRRENPNPDDGDMPVQYLDYRAVHALTEPWAHAEIGSQQTSWRGRDSSMWLLTLTK